MRIYKRNRRRAFIIIVHKTTDGEITSVWVEPLLNCKNMFRYHLVSSMFIECQRTSAQSRSMLCWFACLPLHVEQFHGQTTIVTRTSLWLCCVLYFAFIFGFPDVGRMLEVNLDCATVGILFRHQTLCISQTEFDIMAKPCPTSGIIILREHRELFWLVV